ncbi:MAG: HAF repeat-containing protein [Nitrosomonas sp.]|uniref:HAF repeat-containing protein n=1 Tax=Nitrosomonas sp. TaxID=42353 RepID=UPI001D519D40|nr:HAF repeat-containing protein [Nitrosomonas sp.]MBX9894162.1 HAF repeat-containing protein [Nitrosomonas sp.]
MNTQLANFKQVAIFVAGIYTASIPAVAHADWSIMGLGTLGGDSSRALDINDSGQVVGNSQFVAGYVTRHAFITGPNGLGMIDLGTLDEDGFYRDSNSSGINNSGQVTGTSYTKDGSIHAFITGPDGVGMTDIGTLGGSYSNASDINDSGQVVGGTRVAAVSESIHAFITGSNGIGMTDLGALDGNNTYADGINNSGQVVGYSYFTVDGLSGTRAFITGPNGVGMTDIGTLGGDYSVARDINNYGQVVGSASFINGLDHGFITDPNGAVMTDLGTLGGNNSRALGINDFGEVVGVAATATGEDHSFIYSHGGITDLSLLAPVVAAGWTNIFVNSINNNGQMVGYGRHLGHEEAFLLSYTPDTIFDPQPIYIPPVSEVSELEVYVMLLAGLGLMGYVARRREETFN